MRKMRLLAIPVLATLAVSVTACGADTSGSAATSPSKAPDIEKGIHSICAAHGGIQALAPLAMLNSNANQTDAVTVVCKDQRQGTLALHPQGS